LYDIQPGNGVGLFLRPRSPHGATRVIRRKKLQSNRHHKQTNTTQLFSGWSGSILTTPEPTWGSNNTSFMQCHSLVDLMEHSRKQLDDTYIKCTTLKPSVSQYML